MASPVVESKELPLKLVSLLIAVGLFLIVRSDKDAVTAVSVKVVYTLPKDKVLISDPPLELRVSVRGPWTRLSHLDARDIDPIRVDLTRAQAGVINFDEGMVRLPPGIRAVSMTPAEARLDFDLRGKREVPIVARVDGTPAEGFRVARVTVKPERARLEGAARELDLLTRVATRPLKIDGTRGTIRGDVLFELPAGHIEVLDPQRVSVEVQVVPALGERVLDALPIKPAWLDRGAAVDPPVVKVVLHGPVESIEPISPSKITLELSPKSRGSGTATVLVRGLPDGVTAEARPSTVQVRGVR